jgi:hypothetical protein
VIPSEEPVTDYDVTPDDHNDVERVHWVASIQHSLEQVEETCWIGCREVDMPDTGSPTIGYAECISARPIRYETGIPRS